MLKLIYQHERVIEPGNPEGGSIADYETGNPRAGRRLPDRSASLAGPKAESRFRLRKATADKSLAAAVQGDFRFFHAGGDSGTQMGANFTAFCRLLSASVAFCRPPRGVGLEEFKTHNPERNIES